MAKKDKIIVGTTWNSDRIAENFLKDVRNVKNNQAFYQFKVSGRSNGKAQVIAEKLVKEGRTRVFSEQELLDYTNSIINQTKRSMVAKLKNYFEDNKIFFPGIVYKEDKNITVFLEDICNCILEGVE